MIGVNLVTLIGKVRTLRRSNPGGRFWLDTTVAYADRQGEEKTLEDSVLVSTLSPIHEKIVDGSLILVLGQVDNGSLFVGTNEIKITEVVADCISLVQAGTPNVNRIVWATRLGKEPNGRYTSNGRAVTDLELVWGGDLAKGIPGVWLKATVWGGQAEFANDLPKGTRVTMTGRVHTEKWTDREGGSRFTTKAHVDDLFVVDPPARSRGERGQAPVTGKATRLSAPDVAGGEVFEETVTDDDIPF